MTNILTVTVIAIEDHWLLLLGGGLFLVMVVEALTWRPAPTPRPAYLGTARHSTHEELVKAGFIGRKFGEGIRLGFEFNRTTGEPGQVIRYTGPGNLILVAPPRAGKFRDELAHSVLEFGAAGEGASLIAIDPKGQICAVTQRERKKFSRVVVLSPFYEELEQQGVHLGHAAKFNPMAALNPKAKSFTASCKNLADAIITEEPDSKNRFFTQSARDVVCGFIMYLAESPDFSPEQKTLAYMRSRLATDPFGFAREAFEKGSQAVKENVAMFAAEGADSNKVILDVRYTATTETSFIGDASIRESLSGSDFDFAELKTKPTTVYVVVPTEYLGGDGGRWFRLIVGSAIEQLGGPKGLRVLMLVDEFSAIGRLPVIQKAMAYSAGHGYQVWPVMQSLEQFKMDYKDSWETFIGTAAIKQFYFAGDFFTAEHVSKLCGEQTIILPGASTGPGGSSASESLHQRRLYYPDEVMRLGADRFLMLTTGAGVPHVTEGFRAPYLDKQHCPELQGRYDPDPYEKQRTNSNQDPPPNNNGKMTREVALKILELQEGATRAQMLAAYLRLMKQVHPDKGGSNYFAQQLNAARDALGF